MEKIKDPNLKAMFKYRNHPSSIYRKDEVFKFSWFRKDDIKKRKFETEYE